MKSAHAQSPPFRDETMGVPRAWRRVLFVSIAALAGLALGNPGWGPGHSVALAVDVIPRGQLETGINTEPDPPELSDPEALAEGQRTFDVHCSQCHGTFGGGGMGPNLTDNFVIYGGRFSDILRTVTFGPPGKPMPAWGEKLPQARIRKVAAFVYSLKGTQTWGPSAPPSAPRGVF